MTLFVLALLVFLFPLAYSPGPGNMFFAALGARFGVSATLAANAGYHVATLLVTALIGAGLVSLIDPDSAVFFALKTGGSIYVLWLAWKMAVAGRSAAEMRVGSAGFLDGVMLLVLNPKAYVIIVLMYSQFGGVGLASTGERVAVISLVFTLNNLLAFLLWTLAGDGLGRVFRSEAGARRLNLVFAVVLAGVAFWMMFG
ncbi:LysE family translocator [Hoeflea sp. AS60]|uniref:LysE family translocator n=1 Tax=Hoeflea sp. AS60 TaxID=3135780 RepID=UPI003173CAB0